MANITESAFISVGKDLEDDVESLASETEEITLNELLETKSSSSLLDTQAQLGGKGKKKKGKKTVS